MAFDIRFRDDVVVTPTGRPQDLNETTITGRAVFIVERSQALADSMGQSPLVDVSLDGLAREGKVDYQNAFFDNKRDRLLDYKNGNLKSVRFEGGSLHFEY